MCLILREFPSNDLLKVTHDFMAQSLSTQEAQIVRSSSTRHLLQLSPFLPQSASQHNEKREMLFDVTDINRSSESRRGSQPTPVEDIREIEFK